MAKNTMYPMAMRNLRAAPIRDHASGGQLRIWSAPVPTTGDAASGAAVRLVNITLPAPAFTLSNGVLTSVTFPDATVIATGTAAWCEIVESDEVTVVVRGTVGLSDANLIVPAVDLEESGTFSVTSLTFTEAASSAL